MLTLVMYNLSRKRREISTKTITAPYYEVSDDTPIPVPRSNRRRQETAQDRDTILAKNKATLQIDTSSARRK